jgi:hypothetical protein
MRLKFMQIIHKYNSYLTVKQHIHNQTNRLMMFSIIWEPKIIRLTFLKMTLKVSAKDSHFLGCNAV